MIKYLTARFFRKNIVVMDFIQYVNQKNHLPAPCIKRVTSLGDRHQY
ncbi:hypothetical protein [Neobacillus novalis]|nr:hypothetical protein [Neobacillus novalis]